MLLEPAPRTVRGARDLLSVALQYGNAFGQGLQAAALKPADFFGNDDVLYLMEDMATGEIRLSILWEWLHKGATLTADDAGAGVKAGDTFTPELFRALLAEEYAKLLRGQQPRRPRRLEDHHAAHLARDRGNLRHRGGEDAVVRRSAERQPGQLGPDGGPPADPAAGGRVPEGRDADHREPGLRRVLTESGSRKPQKSTCTLNLAKRAVTIVVGTRHWLRPVPE